MTARQYLQQIKNQLKGGHPQSRMGASILGAFGYIRRRQTVIEEIINELESLGLETEPRIDQDMPLDVPRIKFWIVGESSDHTDDESGSLPDEAALAEEDALITDQVSEFRVKELAAVGRSVRKVKLDDPIEKALTLMGMNNYSQLAVVEAPRSIRGTVSYKSIAVGYLHGIPKLVRDCLDEETPQIQEDAEVLAAVRYLEQHDAVLVLARDKTLSGIITAYDLALEFGDLVDPFKRIAEIETRIQRLIHAHVPQGELQDLLKHETDDDKEADPDRMTMGDLGSIIRRPHIWDRIGIRYDRQTFVDALDQVRELRNQLMHFRGALTKDEAGHLQKFCQLLRQIPVTTEQ